MIEKKLSIQSGLYLAEPLDTWLTAGNQDFAVPEAAGSSARVFLLKDETGSSAYKRDPAFKVMRHDKISYAKPLFLEEFRILANLQNIQGLTPMLQAGFLKTDAASMWPSELAPLSKDAEQKASAAHVSGTLSLFAPDETDTLLEEMDERLADGWLPFLILERRWEDNLYLLCDAGYTRGNFVKNLTMKQVLDISIQIVDMLDKAHQRGATYLDHKLLHYYWNEYRQKVIMLDWNIGHWQPQNIQPEVLQFDLVQFSSRAMHHIFTGRQAPGSVAVGPNRPEDINNSPRHFKASYSYDVQNRLNQEEMRFLEKALDGNFLSAAEMRDHLQYLASKRL
ncbi:MAG: hypothetical protein GX415_03785 [Chloroflexi bacterium]|jgi:hypothetical protein|nr:hypothetical protein [Anaerolineaceae bacterium]NLI44522.1 hypothetical protein [Chloroflexota bacterium]HOE34763.1 hypothetical protein [Anaerolineaceae bacterium]HOT25330.1 hypothetical protein [Anaerolineaceae bacterium]HQH57363.1 hypothetical protein [Anaerolineaceae bacterium]